MALLDLFIPRWIRDDLTIIRADLVAVHHQQGRIMAEIQGLKEDVGALKSAVVDAVVPGMQEAAATLRGIKEKLDALTPGAPISQEDIDALRDDVNSTRASLLAGFSALMEEEGKADDALEPGGGEGGE